jgi:hypothetical protein
MTSFFTTKSVSWLTLATTLAATLGQPLHALADGSGPVNNPFSQIEPLKTKQLPAPTKRPATGHTSTVPARPTPLKPPLADTLLCLDPSDDREKLTPFQSLVQDYISAYYSGNLKDSFDLTDHISGRVFAHAGSIEYVQELQYIDAQSSRTPEAINALAMALQYHWMALYSVQVTSSQSGKILGLDGSTGSGDTTGRTTLGQRRAENDHQGAKIGLAVGVAVFSVIAFFKPQSVPKWLSLVRQLMPVIGVTAGAGIARLTNGYLEKGIPLSPAHIIRLGISLDDLYLDESTLTRDLAAYTVSAGVASTVYEILKAVQVISALNKGNPLKINPLVLVLSTAASFAAEQTVIAGVESYQYGKLRDQIQGSLRQLDQGLATHDRVDVLKGAAMLVQTAINHYTFSDLRKNEALNDFVTALSVAKSDFGAHAENDPRYIERVNEITQELGDRLETIRDSQDPFEDTQYAELKTLSALLVGGENACLAGYAPGANDAAVEEAARMVEVFRGNYPNWLRATENERLASPGESTFHDYIQAQITMREKALAVQMRQGQISDHPRHVLLQAASVLRSSGQSFLKPQGDYLMTIIATEMTLMDQSIADAKSIVIPPPREPLPEGGAP